ncbi:ATP-binding domain-containing protein [Streptomyces sp. CL12]|uniref:ATP-binding domain-containing protein n=1 Tax=Streptomyces sp. CL12 TaxID=3391744 RepID=UPI003A80AF5F
MVVDFLSLAPDQQDVLASLPFDGHHLVTGPPGSGKSVLAVQRAVMLALTGQPVTLLTRSNLLRQSLEPLATALGPEEGLDVSTVHRWLHAWHRALTGRPAPQTDDGWFDWAAVFQVAASRSHGTGPLLVIDEGQDLPLDFYRLCRLIGARTTVFADECQCITDTQSTLAEIGSLLTGPNRHDLTATHRTTRQVAALAARFHVGGARPALPARAGPTPSLRRYGNAHQVAAHIAEHAGTRPDDRVGVILRHTRNQMDLTERLERLLPRSRLQTYVGEGAGRYRTLDLTRPGVTVLNRRSAKGLEFDTVFVPDTHLDAGDDTTGAGLRMLYYVLVTRARTRLFLGYTGEKEPPPVAHVPVTELVRGQGTDTIAS